MTKYCKYLGWGMVLAAALVTASNASAQEKRFDLRGNPIVLLFGAVDLQGHMKVMDNITVGPMLTYWNLSLNNDELTMIGLGARANWFAEDPYQNGFYASAFAKQWSFEISNTDILGNTSSGSTSMFVMTALGGYQWLWDSMSLNLGAGYSIGSLGDIELKDSSGTVTSTFSGDSAPVGGVALEATVGWVF